MRQGREIVDNPCHGQVAYEAYAKAVGGKAWNGEPLKTYDELPERIKDAWSTAAMAVIHKYMTGRQNV